MTIIVPANCTRNKWYHWKCVHKLVCISVAELEAAVSPYTGMEECDWMVSDDIVYLFTNWCHPTIMVISSHELRVLIAPTPANYGSQGFPFSSGYSLSQLELLHIGPTAKLLLSMRALGFQTLAVFALYFFSALHGEISKWQFLVHYTQWIQLLDESFAGSAEGPVSKKINYRHNFVLLPCSLWWDFLGGFGATWKKDHKF